MSQGRYVSLRSATIRNGNRNSYDVWMPAVVYTLISEMTLTRLHERKGATIVTELIICAIVIILATAISVYRLQYASDEALESAYNEYMWWTISM